MSFSYSYYTINKQNKRGNNHQEYVKKLDILLIWR